MATKHLVKPVPLRLLSGLCQSLDFLSLVTIPRQRDNVHVEVASISADLRALHLGRVTLKRLFLLRLPSWHAAGAKTALAQETGVATACGWLFLVHRIGFRPVRRLKPFLAIPAEEPRIPL